MKILSQCECDEKFNVEFSCSLNSSTLSAGETSFTDQAFLLYFPVFHFCLLFYGLPCRRILNLHRNVYRLFPILVRLRGDTMTLLRDMIEQLNLY